MFCMNVETIKNIVTYITDQGVSAIRDYTDLVDVEIDYLAIFSRDEEEYRALDNILKSCGNLVDIAMSHTGNTYELDKPIQTQAGALQVIKVRKPDKTRAQRGAPDFRINNYQIFKEKNLYKSGNFTLMLRKDYEMIELKGVDVLVYIPSKTFKQRSIDKN